MNADNDQKSSLGNIHVLFFLAALLAFPMLFQYIPANDCAVRYAPMAEAFADGDFEMAFHSRFLPLYPILAGSVCFLFKCSGYFACKFVCWLLFSFSVYPLYYLVKLVCDQKKTALISSFLLLFCYPLLAFIGDGTRANLKTFLIICLAWAFTGGWKYGKFKYLLWCSVFAALLTLTRGDSALYAIAVLGVLIIKEISTNKLKFIYKPLIAGALFLLILSPWLYFQYNNIGYPVPETRHGMILNKMSSAIPALELLHNRESKYNISTGKINSREQEKDDSSGARTSNAQIDAGKPLLASHPADEDSLEQRFLKFLKCFFPFYMIFAVIGIVLRLKEKSWNKLESILLALFLGHTFLMIAQVFIADHKFYVSRRYILSTIPLYFMWTAAAFLYIYEKFKDLWRGRFKYLLLAASLITAAILYQQGTKQLFRENCSRRDYTKEQEEISEIINDQNLSRISGRNTALVCNFTLSPIIITDEAAIGYYSKCKVIMLKDAEQNIKTVNKLIKEGNIHFIAIRHRYAKDFAVLNESQCKKLYEGRIYSLWQSRSSSPKSNSQDGGIPGE
jgi:hypothetical protein